MNEDLGECLRGCCWNQYDVCGRKYGCAHHEAAAVEHDNRAAVKAAEHVTQRIGGLGQWNR